MVWIACKHGLPQALWFLLVYLHGADDCHELPQGGLNRVNSISDHLLALVGYMGTHCGDLLQRIKHPGSLLVFGLVFHLASFPVIGHPFPGERYANNIPGQILHGFFIPGAKCAARKIR